MNENDLPEDLGDYGVVYHKVAAAKDMLAVTRVLAMDMMENPYITVGQFIKTLTDYDLLTLTDISESADHPRFQEILLIAEMLAAGEGVNDKTLNDLTERTNLFVVFLTCEALFRKGLVEIFHENMSFGKDAGQNMVVRKKD